MTSIIVLTSMSECKQGDVPLVEYTKYSPVNADINGVSFTSGDYTYLAWGGNPFSFMKYDEGSALELHEILFLVTMKLQYIYLFVKMEPVHISYPVILNLRQLILRKT